MSRLKCLGFVLVLFGFLISPANLSATEASDVYLEGSLGLRVDTRLQLDVNGVLGYCPWEGIGLGINGTQLFSLGSTAKDEEAYLIGPEIRWFLEPFELASSLGVALYADRPTDVYAQAIGTYLFALTPSIAIKSELKAVYFFTGVSSVFLGVGGRLLF